MLNSPKAQKVWDDALRDLMETASPSASYTDKLRKMEVTLKVLPDRSLRAEYQKQLDALKKLHKESSATQEMLDDLEAGRKDLEKKMLDIDFASGGTRIGRSVVSKRLKEKAQQERERKKELLQDSSILGRKLAAQIAEIYARDPKGGNAQMTGLRKDLELALKSLRKGDADQFKLLSDRFDRVEDLYGVNGKLAEHLKEVGDEAERRARKSKERLDNAIDAVKGVAGRIADSIVDTLDRKFGDFGIGPLNLRNAARMMGLVGKAGLLAGRGVWKAGSLLTRGVRAVGKSTVGIASSAIRSVFAPEEGSLLRRGLDTVRGKFTKSTTTTEAAVSPVQSKVQADKGESKRVEEMHWLKRQVYALEALTKGRKKTEGGGFSIGDLASNFIKKFLGKGVLSSLFKKGLMGLIGGGAIAGLLAKFGLVGLAGFAGYKLGSLIYEKFGTEIVDGIEWVMGYVDKGIGLVTDAMEFIGDFIKDPISMLKKVGSKISDMWEKSSIKKMINNPLSTLSSMAEKILPSKETISNVADKTKAMGAEAFKAAKSGISSAAATTSDAVSSGWNKLSKWAGNLFNVKGDADFDGLQAPVKDNFTGMVREYRDMGGTKPVNVNSAYRSVSKQAELHSKNPKLAAPPGRSAHNFGLAVDADSAALNDMDRMGLLSRWGFERPVPGEPWHMQPAGIKTKLSSKGMLSADNPMHQRSVPIEIPPRPVDAPKVVPNAGPRLVQPKATASGGNAMSLGNTQSMAYSDNGLFMFNLGVLR